MGQGLPVLTQPAASFPPWDPDDRSTKSRGMHRVGQASPAGYTGLTESEQEHEVKGPEQGGKDWCQGAMIWQPLCWPVLLPPGAQVQLYAAPCLGRAQQTSVGTVGPLS